MKISACLLMTLRSEQGGAAFLENFVQREVLGAKKHHNHHVNMSKHRSSVHEEGHLRQKEAKDVVGSIH